MQQPSRSTDPRINQWITIEDFTAGCYNNNPISGQSPVQVAQPGYADPNTTKGCIALTGGGLSPLPLAKFLSFPNTGSFTKDIDIYQVGAGLDRSYFYIAYKGKSATTKTNFRIARATATLTGMTLTSVLTINTTAKIVTVGFPFLVRNRGKTTSTKPGTPYIVFPLGQYGQVYFVSGTTISALATGPSTRAAFAYQNRILFYHTTGLITYTTPPNSSLLVNTFLADPTDSNSMGKLGAFGTISAGELFIVRESGSSYTLSGDVNYSTVTKLPGVATTGGAFGLAAYTPAGLIYCGIGKGAWIWNGGNLSQKISQNIDDDFFLIKSNLYSCYSWGEWILFSNSWLYNLRQQSWWKLQVPDLFFFCQPMTNNALVSLPLTFTTAPGVTKFTKLKATTTWTWKSLPIRASDNKYINCRELVVALSLTSKTKITVNLYSNQTKIAAFSVTENISTGMTVLRFPIAGITVENPAISISVDSYPNSAPILHYILLGITSRQHIQTVSI